MNWMNLVQTAISVAPAIVQAVEGFFRNKPKTGPQKAALALQLAQQGLVAAIGIAPDAFGDAEKKLVQGINDAVVGYFNAKGWPTA